MLRCALHEEAVGGTDVGEGAGPASAVVAHPAVFEVGGGHASCGERGAKVASMIEIVFGAPETAVNVEDDRKRSFLILWQTQVQKLIRFRAVGQALVCRWRRLSEDVVRHRFRLILIQRGRGAL